jgi:hypothetical protein
MLFASTSLAARVEPGLGFEGRLDEGGPTAVERVFAERGAATRAILVREA